MIVISIDPGVEVGWAKWALTAKIEETQGAPDVTLVDYGVICPPPKKPWEDRVDLTCSILDKLLFGSAATGGVIEWPQFFESEGGRGSAVTGDLIKLSFAVGRIYETCRRNGMEMARVTVNDWKGQMSKEAVKARIKKRFFHNPDAIERAHSHAWDAIGIGLHHFGKF